MQHDDLGNLATLLVHLGYEYEVKGEMPDPSTTDNGELKIILSILMLMGRLEILVMLVLFSPLFWRD